MDYTWIKASAPGSVFFMGEHAVLHQESALVLAVEKRLTVTLMPRKDTQISIRSSHFEPLDITLEELPLRAKNHYTLSAIAAFYSHLSFGFDLQIDSEIPPTQGLGSSAALVVAITAALSYGLKHSKELRPVFQLARETIRKVQGCGSGADALASTYGGLVYYNVRKDIIEQLHEYFPFTLVYSGYKTPTVDVIKQVENRFAPFGKLFLAIMKGIGECTEDALHAIKKGDFNTLGTLMNIHQGLQDALGVNDETLTSIVQHLRKCPGILGAKISGSGLGDCVLGLGEVPSDVFPLKETAKNKIIQLPLSRAEKGVIVDYETTRHH